MKKHEIQVGGHYTARVSGQFVTVRVEAIRKAHRLGGGARHPDELSVGEYTVYDVTNLATGRRLTFRSAAKFRGNVMTQAAIASIARHVNEGASIDNPAPSR